MNHSLKILFVSAFRTPFIQDDLDVLEKHFMVRRRIGHGIFHITKIILSALSTDVIFCWFASVYAAVAVAAGNFVGVKSIIVVAGVDAAKDKDLDYGIWLSPWRAKLARYALRHASRVLVVDPSLGKDATLLAEYDGENILLPSYRLRQSVLETSGCQGTGCVDGGDCSRRTHASTERD